MQMKAAADYDKTALMVPLLECDGSQCKFIIGDPLAEHGCCGHPVIEGQSWCQHHYGRVFGGGTASEKSAARDLRGIAKREAA